MMWKEFKSEMYDMLHKHKIWMKPIKINTENTRVLGWLAGSHPTYTWHTQDQIGMYKNISFTHNRNSQSNNETVEVGINSIGPIDG